MNKNSQKISFINAKKALLVNFTGSSLHWGCYGTSMEIYQNLLDRNISVEIVSSNVIYGVSPTIENSTDLDNDSFFKNFCYLNPFLVNSISQSDVIVVNGEGTLHRIRKAPLNLLYIMYISKKYFAKEIHLINFSYFPNGDKTMPKGNTKIYTAVLRNVDKITPRENISNKILVNSGIKSNQSFDCLPLFLDRYNLVNCHNPTGNILVTGGVSFKDNRYDLMVDFIDYFLKKKVPVVFLLGAHFSPAKEDIRLLQRLKENHNLSNLEVVQATTMKQWVDQFKSASFLFSARFHHSIAALSIGTPFRYLSLNTPKITAALETIDENEKEFYIDDNQIGTLIDAARKSLLDSLSIKSEKRVNTMISLAKENFIGL